MSDDLDFMPVGGAKPKPAKTEGGAGPIKDEAKPSKPTGKQESAAKGQEGSSPGETGEPSERAELPTWNRARRKRKANERAEQQDDAFQRGVREAGRQVIDFPKLVIGGLVIAIATIAIGVTLLQRSTEGNATAARALHGATTAIVRGQVIPVEEQEPLAEQIKRVRFPIYGTEEERQLAIDEALGAALESGRPGVELDATMVAAAQKVRSAEFDAAVELYDTFLSEADSDHPLRFLALEGKGIALEGKQDLEGALAVFEQIAPEPSDFYRPMALYHRGRVLESLGRTDEALAIYHQFYEEFPPSKEVLGLPKVKARLEKLDPDFAASMEPPPSLDSFDPLSLPPSP